MTHFGNTAHISAADETRWSIVSIYELFDNQSLKP